LADSEGTPDVILIATGSEVQCAVEAREVLEKDGIKTRVVSMPSWEVFDAQPQEWKDRVLPPDVTARLSIEAGIAMGWEKWVGPKGESIAMTGFGASAPAEVLFEKFGFSAQSVYARAKALTTRAQSA
jgi:transketolase